MPNSIYLLRHCEYDNPRNILPGRLPVTLSAEGIAQANKLSLFFSQQSVSKIYSSAVERCKQTSEIISGGTIPVLFDTRILETLSAYQGFWGENQHVGGYHFFSHVQNLGGESLSDIKRRVSAFWEESIVTSNENIIICSHGDPLQVLYSYIHKLPLVNDNETEANIPGWAGKGEFIELVFEKGKLVQSNPPKKL